MPSPGGPVPPSQPRHWQRTAPSPPPALVHDPYSFAAYGVVPADPGAATTPRPSIPGALTDQPPPAADPRPPPGDLLVPPVLPGGTFTPAASDVIPRSPLRCTPALGPKPAVPHATPALRWQRYGIRVSHTQALKELQDLNRQRQAPLSPELPWVVRVGPPEAPTGSPPTVPASTEAPPPLSLAAYILQ
eukprot:EG_transcript_10893